MTTNIGLTSDQLKGSVAILNQLLADEFALYVKARKYHWNVTGMQFHDLHKFFESIYEDLDVIVDDIAERTRALGSFAPGTLTEFCAATKIKENPGKVPAHTEMIKDLLEDHEQLIRETAVSIKKVDEELEDVGTADFLTGIMERQAKTAWMLRSMIS